MEGHHITSHHITSHHTLANIMDVQHIPNRCADTDSAVSMWQKNWEDDCHALVGGPVTALLNTERKLRTDDPEVRGVRFYTTLLLFLKNSRDVLTIIILQFKNRQRMLILLKNMSYYLLSQYCRILAAKTLSQMLMWILGTRWRK